MLFSTFELVTENIFDVDSLNKLSPQPESPGTTFVRWDILNKEEVLSHQQARELNIQIQTRVGQALFPDTIREICEDVIENGWNYRLPQPIVSELETPIIGPDGKQKNYVVRDGNNRFELPFSYFPCAVVSGEEYDLLRLGCISNNPNSWSRKNDCTADDVKAMIQLGFKMGKIEKTEEAVFAELENNYPQVRKRGRTRFVAEILESVGMSVSFQPYTKSTLRKHLSEHFDMDLGVDDDNMVIREASGWGRNLDNVNNTINLLKTAIKNPNFQVQAISYLLISEDMPEKPNENNAKQLRAEYDTFVVDFIRNFCIPVADSFRKGILKVPTNNWIAQVNGKEKLDQFQ
jgi:hypothetical protein